MRIWLEFPVVLPIRTLLLLQTLLYSHSSQLQHLDGNVHRLLSICYSHRLLSFAIWIYSYFIINHHFDSFT